MFFWQKASQALDINPDGDGTDKRPVMHDRRTHLTQICLTGFIKLDITKMDFACIVRHLPLGFVPLEVIRGDVALSNVKPAAIDHKNLREQIRGLVLLPFELLGQSVVPSAVDELSSLGGPGLPKGVQLCDLVI